MTTTTVERRASRRQGALRLAPLAAAVATLLAAPSCWADWRFTPTLNVRETYTDNVDLQAKDREHSDLISEVSPGFVLAVDSRRLKASVNGAYRQFFYAKESSTRNRSDNFFDYGANLTGVVADDLLFVDASASSSRRSVSAFDPRAEDRPWSDLNSTEVRTWRISPYLVQQFGHTARAVLRYTRDSVESNRRTRFGDSLADTVNLNLDSLPGTGKLGWGLAYTRQDLEQEFAGESSTENVNARLRYALDRTLALTAHAGYDRYDYQALGGRTAGRSWSTGFAWTPSQRTSIEASVGRHFYGNTGSLAATVRSRSTVWNINYSDAITNSRSQFTLPSAIDTAALLDQLFQTTIPDPIQRAQAVQAYIQSTGLPLSLSDNVNYLTNRYLRQKLLQGSAALRGARSSAILSMYASERTALSDQASDSALLGSQLASLNNNVRQRGASATFNYRLNPRTSLIGDANYSFTESLTTGRETRRRQLRLGLTRNLGRHVQGTLDLRRRVGDVDITNPRHYTEHALVGAISMTL